MSFTIRYVRADADGTGDGTTDANSGATGAFTLAEMVTDINLGTRAGFKYIVKSGTYSRATTTDTLTGDGTTTSPIVIEGFNTTEGDLRDNGRDANGALVTTNFPEITYTTGRLASSGATHLVFRNLHITTAASNALMNPGADTLVASCYLENSGTNAASTCLNLNGSRVTVRNCDTHYTGGVGKAIVASNASCVITACRIKAAGASGIEIPAAGPLIDHCTIYECLNGIKTTAVAAGGNWLWNTIVNSTGDGISVISTSTAALTISGNHITGSSGWGINFNGCTSVKQLGFNRFRDNTSGAVSDSTDDWVIGTNTNNITSDDEDTDDFTDQPNDNYTLLTTAAAITAGPGCRNPMGAHGAGSFPSGGGSSLLLGGLGQTGIGSF